MSLGSLNELEYYVRFSKEVGYITDGIYEDTMKRCEKAIRTLRGLISYIDSEGGRDGKK
jgi:four helix bundle protein